MLVEGGTENTHFESYFAMRQALLDIQDEKNAARLKAEQFFAEDAYDYEEKIDGRGPFNKFLQMDYALEVSVTGFLILFFKVVMPSKK